MLTVVTVVHFIVCIALILIVLLQTGKGSDIGAAFGGSSQTLFGATGAAGFLEKLTAGAAVVFMLTTMSLAYVSSTKSSSTLLKDLPSAPSAPAQAESPAAATGTAEPRK